MTIPDQTMSHSREAGISPHANQGSEQWDQYPVMAIMTGLLKGAHWPGGAIGALGAALVGFIITEEAFWNRLEPTEFVAALTVGALFTLAGPIMITYADNTARQSAVELDKARMEVQVKYDLDQLLRNNQKTASQNPKSSDNNSGGGS